MKAPPLGESTIILFARDMVAARPLLELKGMGKVALGPGEGGTVCFRLAAEAFAFPGNDLKPVLEPNFCFLPGKAPIRGKC
jgi:beta-glucosidase